MSSFSTVLVNEIVAPLSYAASGQINMYCIQTNLLNLQLILCWLPLTSPAFFQTGQKAVCKPHEMLGGESVPKVVQRRVEFYYGRTVVVALLSLHYRPQIYSLDSNHHSTPLLGSPGFRPLTKWMPFSLLGYSIPQAWPALRSSGSEVVMETAWYCLHKHII